jgi:hypothetical protein
LSFRNQSLQRSNVPRFKLSIDHQNLDRNGKSQEKVYVVVPSRDRKADAKTGKGDG